MSTLRSVTIYTDGACSPNPGPGGWGTVLESKNMQRRMAGGEANTTNNRMEVMAAIKGLEALSERCRVTIVTDSQYLKNAAESWMAKWKRNNWKRGKKNGEDVKNVDLWLALDALLSKHEVSWEWVKGHAGHPGNELADTLAGLGSKGRTIDDRYRDGKRVAGASQSAQGRTPTPTIDGQPISDLMREAEREMKRSASVPVMRQKPIRRDEVKLDKHTTPSNSGEQYRLDGDTGWS